MSFLRSTPVLCLSSFILSIAILIQCQLITTETGFIAMMAQAMLQIISKYHQSTNRYEEPHSIGGHISIDHNLCADITNETISCELRAFNSIIETALDWNSVKAHPETFISVFRDDKAESINKRPPFGTYYEYLTIGSLPGIIVHRSPHLSKHKLFSNGVIIYIHGGGYVIGSFKSDHPFISNLHLFSGLPVLAVDYRLAPEYPLQSGALLEDAQNVVIEYLHKTLSVPFDKMYITGCSAGGGASLQWMHYLAMNGHFVGGVIPISPWTDIRVRPEMSSYVKNGEFDSMLDLEAMQLFQIYALGCRDVEGRETTENMEQCIENGLKQLEEKGMNPLTADWSTWSGKMKGERGNNGEEMKLMFVVSEYEVLRDDATSAHRKALESGIDANIEVSNSRLHCIPLFQQSPEGLEYTAKIAQFVTKLNR